MKYDKIYNCIVKSAYGCDIFFRGNTYKAIRINNVNCLYNYWVYDNKRNIWKSFNENAFNTNFLILYDELNDILDDELNDKTLNNELNDKTSEEKINNITVNPNR